MTLHASQRMDWVRASIWAHLEGLDLEGAALIPAEATRANLDRSAPWIRVGFLDVDPSASGHIDALESTKTPAILVLDVHAPDGANTDQVDLWTADRLASLCRAGMAHENVQIFDYSDPDAPSETGVYILFQSPPPTVQNIGRVEGWLRRRVIARGTYFERLAA